MSDEYTTGYRFQKRSRRATFEFVYPRTSEAKVSSIVVGLEDVRAANDLVIHFDFDRDGWVIDSPTKFMWSDGEDTTDERLEEVAFVPAYSEAGADELDRVNGREPRSGNTSG